LKSQACARIFLVKILQWVAASFKVTKRMFMVLDNRMVARSQPEIAYMLACKISSFAMDQIA
jgi:type IV secretory pathway TrbD component